MNILAIDTSSEYLSLGLQYRSEQIHIIERVANEQSIFLIPKIQELLQQCQITLDDIDAIAYNQGPGSFTGLRIGLSVAMGLAYPRDIKLIPIHGFAIYAQSIINQTQHKNILVGIDARLSQLYVAGVDISNFRYFSEPQVISPHEMIIDNNDIVCVGGGFKTYYTNLPAQIKQLQFLDIDYPNALNILQLLNNKCYVINDNHSEADLLYLRNKVALNKEEQQQAKLNKL